VSPIFLVLLTVAVVAVAVGSGALLAARALRREVRELRTHLVVSRATAAAVPAARTTSETAAIREAVADALAEERERELAEARAFWAAREFGMGDPGSVADAPLFGSAGPVLPGAEHSDYEVRSWPYLPRQADMAGLEPGALHHPSNPEFAVPSPVVANQQQTAERITDLADARIPLTDVRPGPLGTLDVYVFADGTTLCMTPGHRQTAEQLSDALDRGETPVLLGGSALPGAYALTFTYGAEMVYILADRVVASL
jgi:hypothetical protein